MIRFDDIEQPANDLGHPVEMPGAVLTLHDSIESPEIKYPPVLFRVHLFHLWHEYQINAFIEQKIQVLFRGSGIFFQVGGIIELGGVHENADYYAVLFLSGMPDQRRFSNSSRLCSSSRSTAR